MCDHHAPRRAPAAPERAVALEHGDAHDHDHATWSRRDFVMSSGLAAVGSAIWLNGTPVRAMGNSALMQRLASAETDRVFVVIGLGGGNDGLNTVVPITNDLYYNARPRIAIPPSQTVAQSGDFGFHEAMASLEGTWGDGDMAVVHSVGYPDPDLSHFRSSDIWTAASVDEDVQTGWVGRAFDDLLPGFHEAPDAAPAAVQIGAVSPNLFRGEAGDYGMALFDIDTFLDISEGGDPYPTFDTPPTPFGDELAFVRGVANDAFQYRDALFEATQRSRSQAQYPADNPLADSLAACARLVKGRLGARMYFVSLGGFDTHAGQKNTHADRLRLLSEAIAAFYEDLGQSGDAERVAAMTISEFGRRVEENGSQGTDHGTAAPMMLFGPRVAGGFYGHEPVLDDLDADGNLLHSTDFRSVYASVLRQWFGLTETEVDASLGSRFGGIPLFEGATTDSGPGATPAGYALETPFPNPSAGRATLRFALTRSGPVRLDVFDLQGRLVQTLVHGEREVGFHTASFDGDGLANGTYLCRLVGPEGKRTVQLTLAR